MHRPKTYRRKSRKSRKGKRSTKRRVGGGHAPAIGWAWATTARSPYTL